MARDEQRQRSEKVRQAILDTARELGMREGFETLSIRKIIDRMKYSTGVVYYHFKDKQDVLDAIEEAETAKLHGEIAELLDDRKDVVGNMQVVFHRIMTLAREQPELYNLVVVNAFSRRRTEPPAWIPVIAGQLRQGMERGLIREADPEHTAFAVWSSFLGFHLMLSRFADLPAEEAERMFQVQFDLILKGVLAHG